MAARCATFVCREDEEETRCCICITGREDIDKENFIFDHMQGRALLLVPDQFTLQMERALFARTGKEALMDIEVLSLSRLGYRLLAELGGCNAQLHRQVRTAYAPGGYCTHRTEHLQVFCGLERKNSFIER